jgi:5-methyltetrahydrofolate--homocysteine methyltransferase
MRWFNARAPPSIWPGRCPDQNRCGPDWSVRIVGEIRQVGLACRAMSRVKDLLSGRTLLDGAMGTALLARGLDLTAEPPELWNRDRPDDIIAVHRAYVQAGAQAVQTNTFGANRIRLGKYNRGSQVGELNAAGAELARRACRASDVLVIGSIGPTGTTPPPEGNANLLLLEEVFAEQAIALARGGVDLLAVETMYHPKEVRAAMRGCRIGAPNIPVIGSLTCRRAGDGYATGLGFAPDTLIQAFVEEGAYALGVNCTLSAPDMLDLVRMLRTWTSGPVIARPTAAPSAGPPVTPAEFSTGALALLASGATAVGGCCGTGPAEIAAARAAVEQQAA